MHSTACVRSALSRHPAAAVGTSPRNNTAKARFALTLGMTTGGGFGGGLALTVALATAVVGGSLANAVAVAWVSDGFALATVALVVLALVVVGEWCPVQDKHTQTQASASDRVTTASHRQIRRRRKPLQCVTQCAIECACYAHCADRR